NFKITDDTRIRAALPTIKKVIENNGSVILMSHMGRPKNGPEDIYSLRHIIDHLSDKTGIKVKFSESCIGEQTKKLAKELQPGEILLLENLRFFKEETDGDEDFAKELASIADVYINDAFGTAHRAHASTTIIAKFFPKDKMFGYLITNELTSINKVLDKSKSPFTAILGGAKVSSKISIIENLIDRVDNLIIGGGMTFTFIKALGGQIGSSLVEEDKIDKALDVIEAAKMNSVELYLPVDSVNADKFDNEANIEISKINEVKNNFMGLDIGPQTILLFSDIIKKSSTILWNGPMGVFEMPNFKTGTFKIAQAIVNATEKGAFSLVGGGDSVAAINQYNMGDKVSYVSTGGGAMLEFIEGKILPGIKAINE
ncbi:phosphoglycerate kinase, partial [Bacteroidota bacterium]